MLPVQRSLKANRRRGYDALSRNPEIHDGESLFMVGRVKGESNKG